jgi:hypothetical protein
MRAYFLVYDYIHLSLLISYVSVVLVDKKTRINFRLSKKPSFERTELAPSELSNEDKGTLMGAG